MSHPFEPEDTESPGWQDPNHTSRPDPAAFAHADPPPFPLAQGEITTPFAASPEDSLYPGDASTPPPPPFAPSTPSYYPLLYPNNPRRAIAGSALGMGVGIVCGMVIIALLGTWAISKGFFTKASAQAGGTNVTTIITTGGAPQPTPTAHGAVGPIATNTPLPTITTTPGVYATVTPAPKPTVGPTATPQPGVTPTPNPTANPTATAVPPTATPLPPLTVNVNFYLQGKNVTLAVNTAPGASLTISVMDCDGKADPGAHPTGTTDSSGNYSQSWHPRMPMGCNTPSATATVTATLGNQQGTGMATVFL